MQPDYPEAIWRPAACRQRWAGDEFDFSYRGVNYRGQGFSQAIAFCKVGDWGNLKEMSW